MMLSIEKLSRRRFLQLSGAASASGLLLAAPLPVGADVLARADGQALNLFVSVRPDGTVEIIAHRSEMGTGIRTSLPQVVADEMEADWSRVQVIQGLANADYGSQNTDGSRSIRNFYTPMRRMGATARAMLEQAAAARWQVPVDEVNASQHEVRHRDGRALGFGELAADAAALPLPEPASLTLKSASDFRYIGKDVPIVDLDDMLRGNTTYGVDVVLPGMLYASIERTPWMQGKVRRVDDRAARAVPGVRQVIHLEGSPGAARFNALEGVAVLASHTWAAFRGREQLEIDWEQSPHSQHDDGPYLDELAQRVSRESGEVFRARGDAPGALQRATKSVSASYRTPYLAHAPMEPPMATAHLHDGLCEIWACTQTPQKTQQAVAAALELPEKRVKVNVTLLGGGFGRKSKPDFSVEAALLARAANAPVQVVWSREDDIRHDYFHSCSAQHFEAGLDDSGKVTAWLGRVAAPPISSIFRDGSNMLSDGDLSQSFGSIPFDIPNLQLERHSADAHARIGWLRAVYNLPFGFGVSSFADELAHAAGRDPRDFLLDLIGEDRALDFADEGFRFSNYGTSLQDHPYQTGRLKGVIERVTESADWNANLPGNEGWGLAALRSFVAYVAVAARVRVEAGALEVLELHCAMDAGTIVNPDRVHAQMEGAMVFGLSLALNGEINFEGGVAAQSNFHDYPVARMNQVPRVIKTHIVDSDAAPGGVGEPGAPPVAPAIANAVFAASGQRIRELPLAKSLRV